MVTMIRSVGILLIYFCLAIGSSQAMEHTRCYNDPPIGCFSNTFPFNNTDKKPHTIDRLNVYYNHYIGTNSQRFFWKDATKGMKTRFRNDLKTCVIVHGWLEHDHKEWLIKLTQELVRKELMNIIVVDWAGGARVRGYVQGIANGRVVGAMVGLFFKELQANGADLSTFHLIGNSLGAHVCGHIGANAPGIGRITGMDPSGRAMHFAAPEARLDPTDAMVVDVIHTDGSNKLGFGTLQPMGTVDFYVNGGLDQPGCVKSRIAILIAMLVKGIGFNKCSHSRANILFIKSINECSIMSDHCDSLDNALETSCQKCKDNSCTQFGYSLSPGASGIYSFTTPEEPLC